VSPLIPALAALIASASSDHGKLEEGLDLYRRGDLKGSLPLLLDSLDSGTAKQKATARLYIGLIQHRTGNARDAAGSFKHALELCDRQRDVGVLGKDRAGDDQRREHQDGEADHAHCLFLDGHASEKRYQ